MQNARSWINKLCLKKITKPTHCIYPWLDMCVRGFSAALSGQLLLSYDQLKNQSFSLLDILLSIRDHSTQHMFMKCRNAKNNTNN